jgi:acyl carrier protein
MGHGDETKAKIAAFFARFFKNHEVREDDDVFALGLMNSLFAIQLVSFVEKQFKVTIENDDLDIKNFRSINSVADLVQRKTASAM